MAEPADRAAAETVERAAAEFSDPADDDARHGAAAHGVVPEGAAGQPAGAAGRGREAAERDALRGTRGDAGAAGLLRLAPPRAEDSLHDARRRVTHVA